MITLTGLDDFPTALAVLALADGRTALACVHMPTPGTSEVAYSAVYLVDGTGRAVKIGQSEPYGKDIGCALEVVGKTLRLYVTEPPPGGSGAASRIDRYDVAIPVGAASASSAADVTLRAALKEAMAKV
jgi:hypothetical protein